MLKMWRTAQSVNVALAIIFSTVIFTNSWMDNDVKDETVVVKEEPIGLSHGDVLHNAHTGVILRDGNFSSNSSVLCRNRLDTLDEICVQQDSEEQIEEEIEDGECEMLAQLVQAEAGNQDYKGMCLVADVVLNRVNSELFPNSIEEVIFQILIDKNGNEHYQFSTVADGAYDDAGWNISENAFKAAYQEYHAKQRIDESLLSFTAGSYNPYFRPAYKYGDHYFGK